MFVRDLLETKEPVYNVVYLCKYFLTSKEVLKHKLINKYSYTKADIYVKIVLQRIYVDLDKCK